MKWQREGNQLNIQLEKDMNWMQISAINQLVIENPEVDTLIINLEKSSIVDSESIIFMERWLSEGKQLEVEYPPPVYFELLDILDLSGRTDLCITKFRKEEKWRLKPGTI